MASIEKRLERKLCREIKMLGGYAEKLATLHTTGLTDRIVIMPKGKLYWVELKDTGTELRPTQKVWFKRLNRLGHEVWKIDSDEILNAFLKHISQ